MSVNYIPAADAQFDEWMANFAAYVNAHGAALGLSPAEVTSVQTANTNWHAAFAAHLQAQAAARGKRESKDGSRDDTENTVRHIVKKVQANSGTTDEDRKNLRISVADEKRTPVSENVVEMTPAPLIRLDWSQRGRCVIHFGPNPANERENALPDDIRGAKIWFHVGGIPATEAEWQWLADDTNSPYVHAVASATPVTVAYRAQYFDTRMRTGPFCDPAIATITI